MRKEIVNVKTCNEAWAVCPWAIRVVKVEGGLMCFESIADYEIWRNQK